jgi:hypothetical protein
MEAGISILVQLQSSIVHGATTPSFIVTIVDPGVDVRIEETKVIVME